jgi:hypothetical protein
MMSFKAVVQGKLTETVDGVPVVVPRGHCSVCALQGVVSLSWNDDSSGSSSVVLSAEKFERYLDAGAVVITERWHLTTARHAG